MWSEGHTNPSSEVLVLLGILDANGRDALRKQKMGVCDGQIDKVPEERPLVVQLELWLLRGPR